jgi:hypothetical protein
MRREISLLNTLGIKPRNDADSGRIAAYEMDFDFRWWNDVGTDYGRVQSFMGENILGFDTFRILRLWPSMSNFACLKCCMNSDGGERARDNVKKIFRRVRFPPTFLIAVVGTLRDAVAVRNVAMFGKPVRKVHHSVAKRLWLNKKTNYTEKVHPLTITK